MFVVSERNEKKDETPLLYPAAGGDGGDCNGRSVRRKGIVVLPPRGRFDFQTFFLIFDPGVSIVIFYIFKMTWKKFKISTHSVLTAK